MRPADRQRRREWDARPDVQAARAAGKCAARNRQDRPCGNSGNGNNGRCRLHGGTNDGLGNLKHGRSSKVMKGALAGLRDSIARRAADDSLLDLRPGIAYMDEVRDRLLERLHDEGDTPRLRERALEHTRLIRAKVNAQDASFLMDLDHLLGLLERGVRQDRGLMELLSVVERRAMRTESARSTAAKEQATIPARAFEVFVESVVRIVSERVGAVAARQVISAVSREYGLRAPGSAGPLQIMEGGAA